jgi:hypothetical protein
MSDIEPVVRHMLLCDDVQRDPTDPHKVNVLGLVSTIRSSGEPPFPFRHPELCVYVVLTGGRGTGEAEVAAVHADSDRLIFSTPRHALKLGPDPLAIRGMAFRIRGGLFPQPGLYWFEFRYNGKALARQPLVVR